MLTSCVFIHAVLWRSLALYGDVIYLLLNLLSNTVICLLAGWFGPRYRPSSHLFHQVIFFVSSKRRQLYCVLFRDVPIIGVGQ